MVELTQELTEEKTNEVELQPNGLQAFMQLACLFNKSFEQVKDESCLFFIKSLTKKLGKVLVKINLQAEELERSLENCAITGVQEVLTSPAYISTVKRITKKKQLPVKVLSAIDFPFGENLFKSKLADAKNGVKMGVDGFAVMVSASSLGEGFLRKTKLRIKKLAKTYKNKLTLAIAMHDLSEDKLKAFFKCSEKFKIQSCLLVFGNEQESEVVEKVKKISAYLTKSTKILANIESAEVLLELLGSKIDFVYTQSADKIATSLIKRFEVNSVNIR